MIHAPSSNIEEFLVHAEEEAALGNDNDDLGYCALLRDVHVREIIDHSVRKLYGQHKYASLALIDKINQEVNRGTQYSYR